jgi:type VI secretion system protein ImpG
VETSATAAVLRLVVRMAQGATLAALGDRKLRLFLHGDRDTRLGVRLLRALLDDVEAIELAVGDSKVLLAPDALRHAGFAPEAAALPWPRNSFPGFRILQEYLAFPEKFQFVELAPLPEAVRHGDTLTIECRFNRIPDLPNRVTAENFRLNCVPVINLFAAYSDPLSLDPGRMEHRLVPAAPASDYARIHAVNRMTGTLQGSAEILEIPAFESFRHLRPGQPGVFYRARVRPAVLGNGSELWVSFVDGGDRPVLPSVDTIAATLTCTDGEVAQLVPVGGLDQVAVGSPASMTFRNITPITPEAPPPLQGDTLWRLVAGLARSLAPLADIESLRALIAAYDFHAVHNEQQRRRLELMLSGLLQLEMQPMERLVHAIPVRGWEITLTVKESGFGGGEGAFLFGAAFDAFVGVYAGLNTCYRVVVQGVEGKVRFAWPARIGTGAAL